MLFVLETTMFSTFSLVLSQDLRLQGPFSIWWPFQEVQTFAKFWPYLEFQFPLSDRLTFSVSLLENPFLFLFNFFFQGLFIFILHVLRNADVRAAYLRKKQKWKAARSIGTSHSSNHDSIALGSSKIKKEPENSRSKSCCTSPRSEGSVIGYDNPFVFDHDRCMTPVDTWMSIIRLSYWLDTNVKISLN